MKKYQLAAMATVSAMMMCADSAEASGTGFQNITQGLTQSASEIPKALSVIAYLGGLALAIAGIVKLKAHVDNPQTPIKEGLVRIGAGGGLLALPAITDAMTSAVGTGGTANNALITTFDGVSF